MFVQADLRLCWPHIPHCWKSHVAAHMSDAGKTAAHISDMISISIAVTLAAKRQNTVTTTLCTQAMTTKKNYLKKSKKVEHKNTKRCTPC